MLQSVIEATSATMRYLYNPQLQTIARLAYPSNGEELSVRGNRISDMQFLNHDRSAAAMDAVEKYVGPTRQINKMMRNGSTITPQRFKGKQLSA